MVTLCLTLSLLVPWASSETDYSKARSLSISENMIRFENVLVNGNPYWMTYRVLDRGRMVPVEMGLLSTFQIPTANIVIDGNSSDWTTINSLYTDPEHDQEPPDGYVGTDVKKVFIARDDEFIYFAFTLYDGNPSRETTYYITEFQQYLDQYHTAGDTIINAYYSAHNGWEVIVIHRESNGASCVYDSSHVGTGTNFIEYKVPIADIEYDGGGVFDTMGIEGRFIRAYIHYNPNESGEGDTYDGAEEDNRLMIVDFY